MKEDNEKEKERRRKKQEREGSTSVKRRIEMEETFALPVCTFPKCMPPPPMNETMEGGDKNEQCVGFNRTNKPPFCFCSCVIEKDTHRYKQIRPCTHRGKE